jgi:hypothetical protein
MLLHHEEIVTDQSFRYVIINCAVVIMNVFYHSRNLNRPEQETIFIGAHHFLVV